MKPLNRQETEDLIIDLYYNQKKTFREIQQIVRKSPRDIKVILNKVDPGRSSLSIPAQAYRLFSEGKTPIEVAIILNIREPEATQFNLEYWKLSQLDSLSRIYKENNGNISPLVVLHRQMKAAGLTVEHVIRLLVMTNNNLLSVEQKCQDLKREEESLTAKNLKAARTFQQLSSDILEESKILNQYRSSCKKECMELDKLRLLKEKLQSVVRQFQNNNERLQRIKELVKQIIEQRLMNHRHVLLLAFQSIIESYRKDPVIFNILYYNLSAAAGITSTDTRSEEFGMINHSDYGLSTNNQFYCKYENSNSNDVAYSKILLDVAEQFFNRMIKELEQLSITRILEVFISGSISSQSTKKLLPTSKPVLPMQTCGNEKKDPLPGADTITL
jgi:hypothetical protein